MKIPYPSRKIGLQGQGIVVTEVAPTPSTSTQEGLIRLMVSSNSSFITFEVVSSTNIKNKNKNKKAA